VSHLTVINLRNDEIILVLPFGDFTAQPFPVVQDQPHGPAFPQHSSLLGPIPFKEHSPPAIVDAPCKCDFACHKLKRDLEGRRAVLPDELDL